MKIVWSPIVLKRLSEIVRFNSEYNGDYAKKL